MSETPDVIEEIKKIFYEGVEAWIAAYRTGKPMTSEEMFRGITVWGRPITAAEAELVREAMIEMGVITRRRRADGEWGYELTPPKVISAIAGAIDKTPGREVGPPPRRRVEQARRIFQQHLDAASAKLNREHADMSKEEFKFFLEEEIQRRAVKNQKLACALSTVSDCLLYVGALAKRRDGTRVGPITAEELQADLDGLPDDTEH